MLEMPESYLRWRSTPARPTRSYRLFRASSRKSDLSEEQMLDIVKEKHNSLIETTPTLEKATSIQQEANLNGYYWQRFLCGVTLLLYGDLQVVESLFIDRQYLLKECSIGNGSMRFVKSDNQAFLATLLGLLMLMNKQIETYSIENDRVLIDWFRKNKQELVWDNKLRKFLIAQFEEKLNSRDNLSNM